MKKPLLAILCLASFFTAGAQQRNLAEKLGYGPEDKLLIIHADDIGLAHSKNSATIKAMTEGLVNSASIQMPPAWATEVGEMNREHENLDIGIHLTLTNEWFNYKWGPVSSQDEVPSLIGEKGFMYPDCATVAEKASPDEVEKELRAQIQAALDMGLDVTHLDSHMGCIYSGRPEFMGAYLRLAEEFNIPAMVNEQMWEQLIQPHRNLFAGVDLERIPVIENIETATPSDYDNKGMDQYYTEVLENLPAGITALLIHTAYDNDEMRAITVRHDHWHAPWRQDDFDFFTSDKARQLIEENDIKLVTWREIRDVALRGDGDSSREK